MIILPDRNIPRSRFLMPQRRIDWALSSRAIPKDGVGNDTTFVQFIIRARAHDGHVVWKGVFRDRDDFDAVLFAIATGSIKYERDLWRLPNPWFPGLPDGLVYEFASNVFLTTLGLNTGTVPNDWNSSDNTVHCIGGGPSSPTSRGEYTISGSGGAGYAASSNFALNAGQSFVYAVGAGNTNPGGFGGFYAGRLGGSTWFNAYTYDDAALGATTGGLGGGTSGAVFVAGGTGGSGKGDVVNDGGKGGDVTTGPNRCASGGGGAGGPNGPGGDAPTNSGVANTYTKGGDGDAGYGGLGVQGTAGGAGTEWSSSPAYGSGAGGSGLNNNGATVGGGLYGAAGGGTSYITGTAIGGPGVQGMIFIEYTPRASGPWHNISMMGF